MSEDLYAHNRRVYERQRAQAEADEAAWNEAMERQRKGLPPKGMRRCEDCGHNRNDNDGPCFSCGLKANRTARRRDMLARGVRFYDKGGRPIRTTTEE